MSLRWGVLSTARINRKTLPGLQAAGEVVAIASRDGDRARAAAVELGIPRTHPSYEALLADPELDAVYVPLPNSLHVEWTERALGAGKHVLCEKPLSRSAAAAESAFDAADRAGRVLMEAFMYRHHAQTRALLDAVAAGRVGRLRAISASFGFDLGDGGPNIRLDPALDGGALMDVGCYCVHAIRQLAGEPVRVHGVQRTAHGVDVGFAGLLELPDGVLGHFDCGMDQAPRHGLEVIGETGTLRVADPWHCTRPGIELRTAAGSEPISVPEGDPYAAQAEAFARSVATGAADVLGRSDAVGQARVIEALYRSVS